MTDYTVYFNGNWVSLDQVLISPMDRGFLVGDVVFEVERTFNGKSFKLKEHVDRLYRSLKYVRIDPGLSPEEVIGITEEMILRNEHLRAETGDFRMMQFITRGTGISAWNVGPPTVCIKIGPINYWYANAYLDGKHASITRTQSLSAGSIDPKVKHYSRMNFNMAELEANDVESGAWPILSDANGNLTESAWGNMFLVTDGIIRTPGDRTLLQGVSRAVVLDLAKRLDIPIVVEDLQPYDLYTSDEAFFSSTSYCVLPVTRVDRREIGDGKPGPITNQLLAAWCEVVDMDIVDQALQFAKW